MFIARDRDTAVEVGRIDRSFCRCFLVCCVCEAVTHGDSQVVRCYVTFASKARNATQRNSAATRDVATMWRPFNFTGSCCVYAYSALTLTAIAAEC